MENNNSKEQISKEEEYEEEKVDAQYVNEIANTILQQLHWNPVEVLAWGSNNFEAIYQKPQGDKFEYTWPGLLFNVSTPKFPENCKIVIYLDEGADTYVIQAFNKENLIGTREDIYFNEIHSAINSLIEDEESIQIVSFRK